MARRRDRAGGRPGGGGGGADAGHGHGHGHGRDGGHKERRRAAREEARRAKKAGKRVRKVQERRVAAGKAPMSETRVEALVDKQLADGKKLEEALARDSQARRMKQKLQMYVQQLRDAIEKDEEELLCWYPGKADHLRRREEEKNKYDPNKLTGAARPAEEAYPWLYPDYHARKEREAREEEERELNKGDNILADFEGHWGKHARTRQLAGRYLELAIRLSQGGETELEGDALANARKICSLLTRLQTNDQDGALGLWLPWLAVAHAVQDADLAKIRAATEMARLGGADDNEDGGADQMPAKSPFAAMLLWDTALYAHVSAFVLKEGDDDEGNTEETARAAIKRAVAANPCIARCLLLDGPYEDAIDGSEVDEVVSTSLSNAIASFVASKDDLPVLQEPAWSPEEQAVIYFVRSVSAWRDTDPCYRDMVAEALQARAQETTTNQDASDQDISEEDTEAKLPLLERMYHSVNIDPFADFVDEEEEDDDDDDDDQEKEELEDLDEGAAKPSKADEDVDEDDDEDEDDADAEADGNQDKPRTSVGQKRAAPSAAQIRSRRMSHKKRRKGSKKHRRSGGNQSSW